MITEKQKKEFIAGYLEAARWSSSDRLPDGGEEEYVELDNYDWADGEAEKLHASCCDFLQEFGKLVERYARHREAHMCSGEYTVWECVGHDFWLTRNGHGAGFWDGRGGPVGNLLTQRVGHGTPYPPIDLTLGDDLLVYSNEHPTAYCVKAGEVLYVYGSLTDAHQARKLFERGRFTAATEKMLGTQPASSPHYWYKEPGNILHCIRIVERG